MIDLPTFAFLALRHRFFDSAGRPVPFRLRDKRNTQDDPFDEYLVTEVLTGIEAISCARATGPLITPDMVLYRPRMCEGMDLKHRTTDINRIVGIEVKKLERTAQGGVARGSGLDYNTTPPAGVCASMMQRVQPSTSAASTYSFAWSAPPTTRRLLS